MNNTSVYEGERIVLTTKHSKEIVIEPVSKEYLGAGLLVLSVDTDELGTFSGEIERQGTAQEIVKKKAEWGMNLAGADYGIATEGSFGPHPAIPFCPSGHEIIHFIDKKRDFHLQLSELTVNTNYNMCTTDSVEELISFASGIDFPSHGLILRPNVQKGEKLLFKGICKQKVLLDVFDTCKKNSGDDKVLVQTDMRAHMNPTRMKVIGELTSSLAKRLLHLCPGCGCPGWGVVSIERGLECKDCQAPTGLEKAQVYGCAKCDYKERGSEKKGGADPWNCDYCNP
jgi:hypothetical protein